MPKENARRAGPKSRPSRKYYVYVIELKPEALHARRRKERPRPKCYYVGQSVLTPEERFQQHKEGYKSSRIVHRYHIRLVPELFPAENPISTRRAAEALEEEVALGLERAGHDVHWG